MDELNQVLERMRIAFEEKNKNTLHMPLHGSISEGGNLTTASHNTNQNQMTSRSEQKMPSSEGLKNTNNLSANPSDQAKLCELLAQCYDSLNTYGKTPEQLENHTAVFLMILGDYSFEKIKAALVQHMKQSSSIPTPADIENIINPPPQPLSTSMYVKIMKECTVGGKFLYGDKKEFVEAYEAQEMKKARGGSMELKEAQAQIEQHKQQYLESYYD